MKSLTYFPKENYAKLERICSRDHSRSGDCEYFKVVFEGKTYDCSLHFDYNKIKNNFIFSVKSHTDADKLQAERVRFYAYSQIQPLIKIAWKTLTPPKTKT